jgi:prepilin-type N-terminal cleavage/methylation domain-containing protein
VGAQGEEGFTLIELAIVLVILPIIIGGVSVAVITSLKDSSGVQNRIGDSADAQVTSAYYVRDVQSATDITISSVATDPAVCAAPSSATSSTLLLALYWPGSTSGDTVTSYWLVSHTQPSPYATTYQLVRSFCPNASATSTTPISPSETSALALDPLGTLHTQQPATVTCATTVQNCGAYTSGWMLTSGVSSVALSSLESGSAYQYNLSAAPRFWNSFFGGLPSGGIPFPPLTLLSSSGTVIAISAQNDHVNVIGGIGLNSNNSKAIDITASNSSVSNTGGPFDVFDCGSPCNVVTMTSSGDSGPAGATSVSSSYLAPSVSAPDTSMLPSASCTKSGSTYTCPPGKYSSSAFNFLTSGNSFTINFSGPASSDATCPYCYELQGQLVASTQNNTFNFGNGNTVVFDNGLAVSASGTTLTGTGAFLYVAGGAFAVNTQNNTVQLAPQTSGSNAGIVLYQAISDINPVVISASSNTTDTYGGAVEAPGASVQITAQSNGLTLGSLIAQSLSISGSGAAVTIG